MTSERLPRTTAGDVNISSPALEEFLDAAGEFGGIDSVMVLRHGKVVAERWWPPAAPSEPHVLWSVSKSFTSAAIGLAMDAGLLALDDRVVDLLPEYVPDAPSANLSAMTVRDLLTMTSGHGAESLPDEERELVVDWLQHILEQPVPFAPGTHFVYNSGATYLLSAILRRRAGTNLLAFLQPRLLEPLGIHGMTTEQSPQGIDCGGWGMFATTEDLARFGQLYLQDGEWNGQQLLPAEWVRASTSHQVATPVEAARPDWSQGYGYLFWQCRHGAFRADGMAGQYVIVLPQLDVVVAMTANLDDMQAELELVWTKLLPIVR